MGPPKAVRSISQSAFDEMVKENMDDLGMDPTEALEDAIQTLTLQGVNLSGIVTCVPGESSVKDNPVIQCLNRLKQMNSDLKEDRISDSECDELAELFDKVCELCCIEGSGNAAIAVRNDGVDLVCSLCSKIPPGRDRVIVSCLKAMPSLLHGTL